MTFFALLATVGILTIAGLLFAVACALNGIAVELSAIKLLIASWQDDEDDE